MKTHYKSIFISDIHLGDPNSKTDLLLNFLKNNSADNWFLVGDIIDGWKVISKSWYWDGKANKVVRKFLKISRHCKTMTYIIGNHDEFLRQLVPYGLGFDNIQIVDQYYYETFGKKYLLIHGDLYDNIVRYHKWVSLLGDYAYSFLIKMNNIFNWFRIKFGLEYWSLSSYIKQQVKQAMIFVCDYEQSIIRECKNQGCYGVICGHIHHPEIKEIDGIKYMNCGDWIESLTVIVEDAQGNFKLVYWKEIV